MTEPQQLGDAVVAFALEGTFPDDISSFPPVSTTELGPAIEILEKTKTELEAEIHTVNEETRGEVSSWERNAKSLQEDIIRSKTIANEILRQSEAPETSGEAIEDAEEKAQFLNREVQYTQQLYGVLKGIQYVNQLLGDVEKASKERRILDSLRLLEKSWAAIDELGVSKTCRVMRLLDIRSFELKSEVHAVFDRVWKELVQVDIATGQVAIYNVLKDDQMTLADAVVGLKAYKEVAERMEQLWRNIDAAIVSPRMNKQAASLPKIQVSGDLMELDGRADHSIEALIADLKKMFTLLASKLPEDLLQSLCPFIMSDLVPKLIQDWLSPAIPTSLDHLAQFEQMIEDTASLCRVLAENGYSGFEEIQNWVDNAPEKWLGKCRETALDTIRSSLAKGIGGSKPVEKVEKQMVSLSEGKELANTGAGATAETNDWGDDWGDEWNNEDDNVTQESKSTDPKANDEADGAEDDGAEAWGWDDDDGEKLSEETKKDASVDDEDESAEAWGWGEEDVAAKTPEKSPPSKSPRKPKGRSAPEETRELILKETYHISSMPEPVLDLIFSILEDAAALSKDGAKYGHVASTAPGLFGLPTMALALFRAVSPHYYYLDGGGNMFLYNDALYLAERLSTFSAEWKQRDDLTAQAKDLLAFQADVKSLQAFANRSYTNEMNVQKTILRDLIGGSQSLTGQDEWEAAIESGTARIRAMAATWEPILARSVWSQAVGSLADALATKLITDVLEMPSIGQEEAYSIAKAIAKATELDDLFLPSRTSGAPPSDDEVPTTAQYAPSWLRLKYLSEVLQSNLNEVKYLWCDSELSLYFSLGEVVDLIEASFENNARTKSTIREIQAKPEPFR
ncbi:unnamed protein product [Clonostachys rosea f. rosea IK726]|uniref:ZW10 C-terminal helical domain-containing protein n=2 Tax=Bionectria ochroleuca TaxID=29856 RepID=A0A0B7JYR2_BIOOC|nr:unnamed protein product [Clonostachys rosea f. rosea IK726]